MVLESSESVRRRGIRPIARIAGATRATDPTGLIQLEPTGEALAWAISKALEQAGEQPDALTCIHAHGTGTAANDRVEWRALRAVLGDATVPVVSIKGAIGHLLGAAGAVELGAAALACRNGVSPGTATLIEPDPELDRMPVPASAFTIRPGPILKTSLGFGGHVAAMILTPE
jgi:3-oxoacyl-[acyl-carrier-protein] synthase II